MSFAAVLCIVCAVVAVITFIVNPVLPKMWQRAIAVVIVGVASLAAVLLYYAWRIPLAATGDKIGTTIFIVGGVFLASWAIAKMTECGPVRTSRVTRH